MAYYTPLLGGCTLQQRHVSRYTSNVQFDTSNVLYEIGKRGRAVADPWYVCGPPPHHLLSPKQHSMIRVKCIPRIDTKRKSLTKGRVSKYTCTPGGHVRRFPSCTWLLVSPCATHFSLTFTLVLTHLPCITEWYEDIRRTSLVVAHSLLS